MSVVEVSKLTKSFRSSFLGKKTYILNDVNFKIDEGQVVGFVGSNGSGKTTTMKCMLDLNFPDIGEVYFFGKNRISNDIKKEIGFLPESPRFYGHLTGLEILIFYAKLSQKIPPKDIYKRANLTLKEMGLLHAKNKKIKEYSNGMRQRIGLAQAFIHEPKLIILDEPMAALDQDGQERARDLIKRASFDGASVFLSSHLLYDVEKNCNKLIVLKSGKITYNGSMKDLLNYSNDIEIVYEEDELIKRTVCSELSEVQKNIDLLRRKNISIIEIIKKQKSLKDIFSKINQ